MSQTSKRKAVFMRHADRPKFASETEDGSWESTRKQTSRSLKKGALELGSRPCDLVWSSLVCSRVPAEDHLLAVQMSK